MNQGVQYSNECCERMENQSMYIDIGFLSFIIQISGLVKAILFVLNANLHIPFHNHLFFVNRRCRKQKK